MTNQGDPCIRKECNGIYIWKSCKTCGRRKIDKLVCNICGIATGFGRIPPAIEHKLKDGWQTFK